MRCKWNWILNSIEIHLHTRAHIHPMPAWSFSWNVEVFYHQWMFKFCVIRHTRYYSQLWSPNNFIQSKNRDYRYEWWVERGSCYHRNEESHTKRNAPERHLWLSRWYPSANISGWKPKSSSTSTTEWKLQQMSLFPSFSFHSQRRWFLFIRFQYILLIHTYRWSSSYFRLRIVHEERIGRLLFIDIYFGFSKQAWFVRDSVLCLAWHACIVKYWLHFAGVLSVDCWQLRDVGACAAVRGEFTTKMNSNNSPLSFYYCSFDAFWLACSDSDSVGFDHWQALSVWWPAVRLKDSSTLDSHQLRLSSRSTSAENRYYFQHFRRNKQRRWIAHPFVHFLIGEGIVEFCHLLGDTQYKLRIHWYHRWPSRTLCISHFRIAFWLLNVSCCNLIPERARKWKSRRRIRIKNCGWMSHSLRYYYFHLFPFRSFQ